MSSIFFKDKKLVGVDISQTGIKALAVEPHKWRVQGYGSIDLDPVLLQTSIDNPTDPYLAESLKFLFSNNIIGTLPSNHIALSVPTTKSFTRTLTVPIKEMKKIQNAIEIEVEQYIPLPYSTLYVAHEVFAHDKNNAYVSLTATPKYIVDKYITAARQAHLEPVLVEPSINSVARLLRLTEEGHLSTLIIDISQATTDIAIYDRGAIQVSGGVDIGGNTFTIELSKKLKIPLENAHQLKILNGLNPSPRQKNIEEALRPILKKISGEVRKVIRYYTERVEGENQVDQLIILGAGSNMPGIGDFFTNDLIMPARVANPWQRLNFDGMETPAKQFRPRYITVAGLASAHHREAI